MAARTRKLRLTDEWRQKIRVSAIVNRLQSHVSGKVDMSATQIAAARILLSKSVPDLQSIDVGNKDGKPFQVTSVETDKELL
jgi:hypothetical protein